MSTAAARTGMTCFRVEGGWLTDHARDRVFDYSWDDALRFVLDSIDGMDASQAAELLSGPSG